MLSSSEARKAHPLQVNFRNNFQKEKEVGLGNGAGKGTGKQGWAAFPNYVSLYHRHPGLHCLPQTWTDHFININK